MQCAPGFRGNPGDADEGAVDIDHPALLSDLFGPCRPDGVEGCTGGCDGRDQRVDFGTVTCSDNVPSFTEGKQSARLQLPVWYLGM